MRRLYEAISAMSAMIQHCFRLCVVAGFSLAGVCLGINTPAKLSPFTVCPNFKTLKSRTWRTSMLTTSFCNTRYIITCFSLPPRKILPDKSSRKIPPGQPSSDITEKISSENSLLVIPLTFCRDNYSHVLPADRHDPLISLRHDYCK